MSPSAIPATQSEGRCHQVPRLPNSAAPARPKRATRASPPRKVKVDVTKRHTCHANSRGARQTQGHHQSQHSAISPTPATQSEGPCRQAPRLPRKVKVDDTPATQSEGPCHQVPRLPRKVKVYVTKRHACHANHRGARQTPARHQSQPNAASATLATQSDGLCRQVPRLPRKQPRRPPHPSAPPEPAQCRKCHACHAK